ncbi:MAG: polysulfide reductase NrfD [Candidatus Eremiobacteraeota bacterium]|nr:polysulfide reductase NrfD [Candidatus Eremiobacteraeota bacterium]
MRDTFAPPAPDDAPLNYFERPVLKRPQWGGEVIAYLFLGGIMGGCGIIAMLADRSNERNLALSSKLSAFALASVCPVVLISHLGKPKRFLHMLRIVKLKSPMSMGVWGLIAFSGTAGAAALGELATAGRLPRYIRALSPPGTTLLQGLLGAFMTGYTGVLLSATAVPIWAKGKRHIPAACVCSGLAGAAALNALLLLRGANHEAIAKLERLEVAAGAAELLILLHFRKHAGDYGKPMYEGALGERFFRACIIGGLALPLAINSVSVIARPKGAISTFLTIAAGALTLGGGVIFRQTLIESGKRSADDPKAGLAQPT